MKKNKFLVLLTLITIALSVISCGISPEEQKALKEQIPYAEAYYENKYNTDIEITESTYNYYISDFIEYIKYEMIFTTSENTMIFYSVWDNTFSDNRQQTQINEAIQAALLPELCEYIKNPFYWETDINDYSCNLETAKDTYEHSFFHEYYDKNAWVDFFEKEKPSIYFDNDLYIISNENTKYEEIAEYINALFSQYMYISSLDIVFLSEDLYQAGDFYEFEGEEGFYQTHSIIGNYSYVIKQNYVKIEDGVYITSLDTDFEYEEADFDTSNRMIHDDAISLYNDAYSDKMDGINPNSFNALSGYAFELALTDHFKTRTGFDDYDYQHYCIKIVPEELNSKINSFFIFTTYEDDEPDFYKFSLEDEPITHYVYLRYTDTTKTYLCFGEELDVNLSMYIK